ncbi:3-oxo-tetronate 4-phosphate decarboxylase [Paeniglutamicibacter psychrophenolicus]|uniref:3-oxo-tetronate 4-phosphate decarboxylase n=1 Tax=Paeniglutamicibacter psychrophenolicus TaxID=257454 RepID=UPI0027879E0B|nr:aldolase [Paeniglutamicibacter psychrophenolicus]MDQ0093942.1 ribulose-5-phosphate 4-epimerase/fuculose-1-phosphate aldolase [Paeniglutamicibacter psychrophenolicus]
MKFLETRAEMVELAASLFQRGYSVGSAGNISVRVADGYLMTPTNSSLGRLDAGSLSLLDHGWNHISGDAPSKEVVMHRAMYEARPDTGAIVHLHSTHVTALSCLAPGTGSLIEPHTPYLVMRLGEDIPLVPYYKPGDPGMERDIFEAAREAKAIILGNHGSIVAGKSLVNAVDSAEELEVSAQLALLLRGRDTRPLTGSEIDALMNR